MTKLNYFIILSLILAGCRQGGALENGEVIFKTDFKSIDSANWKVESEIPVLWNQLQGEGFMEIDVPKGITVWFNRKLERDVIIEFEATVVDEGGPNDRASDLNCFWMASDPDHPADFFQRGEWRKGVFWHYYSLQLYYVGLGGHNNTKTRFRKYHGLADPLPEVIREYTSPDELISPNQRVRIRITCIDGTTQYFYNDKRLFELNEDEPLKEGYFGFRTVNNHMKIHSFTVYKP